MRAASFVLAIAMTLLATGCEPTPDTQVSEIRERLVGTWLRDYDENGTHVRRILVLAPDGHFREVSRTLGPDEAGTRHEHEGDWVYDGTNLKRKYTRIDGKPPGAPTVPFAAFQIEFTGSHDFTGIDNVRHREVHYHRVPDGTMP